MKSTSEVKVRRQWGNLNPTTRIHGQGKQGFKPKFAKSDRHGWKRDI
jgi:hypothetical protein